MSKPKKKRRQTGGIMGRSDIPLALRIKMQQRHNIGWSREQSARMTMYCWSVAMHMVEGKGYKSLVRFAARFREKAEELTARYAREGEGFLLEYLKGLGFVIVDGHAVGFVDEDNNPVRQKVEGLA